MKCPECHSGNNTVAKTTKHDDTNRRVRECRSCEHVWITWEVNNSAIMVIEPTKKTHTAICPSFS